MAIMRSKKGEYSLKHTTIENSKQPSIFKGLILAILSGVCYSLISAIVKKMKNLHPGQLCVYRFMAIFTMSLPQTVMTQQNVLGPRNLWFLLVLRGMSTGISSFLNFIAFRYLGLVEACVIIFSAPPFVTILAKIFLKEPCNIFQSIAVVLTVMGLIFTAKLPKRLSGTSFVYNSEKIYGFLAAIFSLFAVIAYALLTRKLKCVHSSVLTFQLGCIGMLETAILTAVFANFQFLQCGIQTVYILILAVLSYTGVTMAVKALQCENAGPVITMRASADITTAFLWQIFIFHDVPDIYEILGALMVLISIAIISLGKWLISLKEDLLS